MKARSPRSQGALAAIEEVASLLTGLRVTPGEPLHRSGEHIAVSLTPRRREDHFRLLINFHPFGHRSIDWSGFPIIARQENPDRDRWIAVATREGRCTFERLPVSDYTLSASAHYGGSSGSVLNGTGTFKPTQCQSTDRLVKATLSQLESGDTLFTFETEDKSLAKARVVFALVQDTGWVWQRGELSMEAAKGRNGTWIAQCIQSEKVNAPCRLVFNVFKEKLSIDPQTD